MFYEKERKINRLKKRVKELEAEIESTRLIKVVEETPKNTIFKLEWGRKNLREHILSVKCRYGDSMRICGVIKYEGDKIEFDMGGVYTSLRDKLIERIEDIKDLKEMKGHIFDFLKDRLIYKGKLVYGGKIDENKVYIWCSEPSENGGYDIIVGRKIVIG